MLKAAENKKKILTIPSLGPLEASNPVLYQRGGAGLPCVNFKDRSTGRGSED